MTQTTKYNNFFFRYSTLPKYCLYEKLYKDVLRKIINNGQRAEIAQHPEADGEINKHYISIQ